MAAAVGMARVIVGDGRAARVRKRSARVIAGPVVVAAGVPGVTVVTVVVHALGNLARGPRDTSGHRAIRSSSWLSGVGASRPWALSAPSTGSLGSGNRPIWRRIVALS